MLPKIYRSDPDIRRHQINTLKVFNDNVTEICEGLEYQVAFKSGRNDLHLNVSLSNDFPNEKPILKISPPVVHHWINGEGEVTSAPGLLNFTIHSDLGRVVQAIIRELERNPPPLLNESPKSNITSPINAPIRDGDRSSPGYCGINHFSSPTHLPQFSATHQRITFPELNNLSLEDLEFLNSNVDKQEHFLNEIPTIKEQHKLLDELILQIEELAESNLSKQEHLKDLKISVDKRIEEVTKLAFENEKLHMEYQNLSDKYSPNNIKEKLRIAATKAELDSEEIAEKFLRGEIDVDKFVNVYTQVRTLCQARKTKEEKLSQQLAKLEKAGF